MQRASFKYCYNYARLSGVTFGLTNTSVFAPINRTELYTSANMQVSTVNGVDIEMIFTATQTSARFYITRGWAPTATTATVEEVYLDYLNITEVPSQVNTISCASINENMVMLANSGINTADMNVVAPYLNAYYNRTHTAAEYQAILSHCTGLPASYVLAAEGAEAGSVEASYARGFNGMERDDDTYGEGNAYDFGARIYDSRLGRWLSVDPLQAEYPSQGSYNFSANNPILYVDRDGRKVFIYGKDAENTVCALQKTTSMQLSYDLKTHQLTATGDPQNDYDRALLAAINDPNINVNLYTTEARGYTSKDGTGPYPILIGAYEGSEVVSVADKGQFLADVAAGNLSNLTNENYGQTQVQTTQLFNFSQAEAVEKKGGEEAGRAAGHEILESYFGGVNSPGGSYASSYDAAHHEALIVDPIAAANPDQKAVNFNRRTGVNEYGWEVKSANTILLFSDDNSIKTDQFQKPKQE